MLSRIFLGRQPQRRAYYSLPKDPNIRARQPDIVGQLKKMAFSPNGRIDSAKLEATFRESFHILDSNSLLDVAYYLSRILRRSGFAMDPDLFKLILSRVRETIPDLSRTELIRVIQTSSFAISKRKLNADVEKYVELGLARDSVVLESVRELSSRIEDLATSSLGVTFSSLCRVYQPELSGFLQEVTGVIRSRILLNLSSPDPLGPSATLARGELLKAVPYMYIGYSQIGQLPPSDFTVSAISLSDRYVEEVPFAHLSQFIYGIGASGYRTFDDGISAILKYTCACISSDLVDNFTVMDLARIGTGMGMIMAETPSDRFPCALPTVACVFDIVSSRPSKEWDMHALLELSRLVSYTVLSFPEPSFLSKFESELRKQSSSIPPQYAAEIFCNIVTLPDVPQKLKLRSLSVAHAHVRHCPPDQITELVLCLADDAPASIVTNRATTGIIRCIRSLMTATPALEETCRDAIDRIAVRNKFIHS
jgi:hypothetical protein